jgi:acyl-CoA thioesterase II
VLAQALVAARRTVGRGAREAHSLHAYFILAGDLKAPIVYFVDTLRDGGSFTTRRVTAIQHGEAIFNLSASFHTEQEGVEHQATRRRCPSPRADPGAGPDPGGQAHRIPEEVRGVLTQDRPLDFRPVDAPDLFDPEPALPSAGPGSGPRGPSPTTP